MAVFALYKFRRIWQIDDLQVVTQREKAADDRAWAIRASTRAIPVLACKGIQPVVDRDLLALANILPGKHMRTLPHRIRVARVVEVAAGSKQNRAALPIELAQMALILLGQRADCIVANNLPVPAAEDKLAALEITPGKHALAFTAGFFDDDVGDHDYLGRIPLGPTKAAKIYTFSGIPSTR